MLVQLCTSGVALHLNRRQWPTTAVGWVPIFKGIDPQTEYRNNVPCQKTSAFVLGFNWHFSLSKITVWHGFRKKSTLLPADGMSASLLHPPLPRFAAELVFVIERIHGNSAVQ